MATVGVSYVPGALTAVAGDRCWALVEASPDSPATCLLLADDHSSSPLLSACRICRKPDVIMVIW